MNKYKVYIKSAAVPYYSFTETVIFGYSEEDALVRNKIDGKHVESIYQQYI